MRGFFYATELSAIHLLQSPGQAECRRAFFQSIILDIEMPYAPWEFFLFRPRFEIMQVAVRNILDLVLVKRRKGIEQAAMRHDQRQARLFFHQNMIKDAFDALAELRAAFAIWR